MDQDGPAKRTRSLAGRKTRSEDLLLQTFSTELTASQGKQYTPPSSPPHTPRSKTPSGDVISASVKDIRNFFSVAGSSDKDKCIKDKLSSSKGIVKWSRSSRGVKGQKGIKSNSSAFKSSTRVMKHKGKNTERKTQRVGTQVQLERQDGFSDAWHQLAASAGHNSHLVSISDKQMVLNRKGVREEGIKNLLKGCVKKDNAVKTRMDQQDPSVQSAHNSQSTSKEDDDIFTEDPSKCQQSHADNISTQQQISTQQSPNTKQKLAREEPEAMDLKTVIKMFQEIRSDIRDIKGCKLKERIEHVEQVEKVMEVRVERLEQEVARYKLKDEILTGVVKKLSCEVDELKGQMENLRVEQMSNMVTLSGFIGDPDLKTCKRQIKAFIEEEMGVNVNIVNIFQIGRDPKTNVLTLSSKEEKIQLFQGVKHIKNMVNQHGKKYIFRDYLPPAKNEQKRWEVEIMAENNRKEANKVDMSWVKSGLQIKNRKYRKKIQPPNASSVLSMTPKAIDLILEMDTVCSEEMEEQGSVFIGYAVAVNTYEAITKAYLKLRLIYPDASHITCAYFLPVFQAWTLTIVRIIVMMGNMAWAGPYYKSYTTTRSTIQRFLLSDTVGRR